MGPLLAGSLINADIGALLLLDFELKNTAKEAFTLKNFLNNLDCFCKGEESRMFELGESWGIGG